MSDGIAHLQDLFASLGPVSARRMFGGHGLYFEGTIFGIVIGGDLYLKTDPHSRQRFEDAGCVPFVYSGRGAPVATSYWSVPAEAMESSQAMLSWVQLAHAAALRKPLRKPRKRSDAT